MLADVEGVRDVPVSDPPRELHLSAKPGQRAGIQVGQDPEHDELVQLEIMRLVDRAHPARPEHPLEPVPSGQQRRRILRHRLVSIQAACGHGDGDTRG